MPLDQAGDIELVLAVEAVIAFRHVLPQQAVGADHRQLAADRGFGGMVDHQQMVADLVERILVAARQQGGGVGDRGAVLVEHPVAQLLRALHLALALGEPHFERSEPAERPGRAGKADRLDDTGCGERRLEPGDRRLRCGPHLLRPQHLNQALRRSRQFAVLHEVPRDRLCPNRIGAAYEGEKSRAFNSHVTPPLRPCDRFLRRSRPAPYFNASGFSSSRKPINSWKNCMRFFSIITVCVPSLSSMRRLYGVFFNCAK